MIRRWFKRGQGTIKVHLLIKGRIGPRWMDVDEWLRLPVGTSLNELVDAAERRGIPVRAAIEASPHLAHTVMVNGERCSIMENGQHQLTDGDQVYLLAPLAGG